MRGARLLLTLCKRSVYRSQAQSFSGCVKARRVRGSAVDDRPTPTERIRLLARSRHTSLRAKSAQPEEAGERSTSAIAHEPWAKRKKREPHVGDFSPAMRLSRWSTCRRAEAPAAVKPSY